MKCGCEKPVNYFYSDICQECSDCSNTCQYCGKKIIDREKESIGSVPSKVDFNKVIEYLKYKEDTDEDYKKWVEDGKRLLKYVEDNR